MVDEDIAQMYDMILSYVSSKNEYYNDPSKPDVELSDFFSEDLTSLVDLIQRQIRKVPSIGEAATVKAYRDINSTRAEYNMRKLSRSDYWKDAGLEETINVNKWKYNKKLSALQMGGSRTEA